MKKVNSLAYSRFTLVAWALYIVLGVTSSHANDALTSDNILIPDKEPRIEVVIKSVDAAIKVRLNETRTTELRVTDNSASSTRQSVTNQFSFSNKNEIVRTATSSANASLGTFNKDSTGLSLSASTSKNSMNTRSSELKIIDEKFYQYEKQKTEILTEIGERKFIVDDDNGELELQLALWNPLDETIEAKIRVGVSAVNQQGDAKALVSAYISEAGRIQPDGAISDSDTWISIPPGELNYPVRYKISAGRVNEWLEADYNFRAQVTDVILRKPLSKEEFRPIDVRASRTRRGYGALTISDPDTAEVRRYWFAAPNTGSTNVVKLLGALDSDLKIDRAPNNEFFVAKFMGRVTLLRPGAELDDVYNAQDDAGAWFVLSNKLGATDLLNAPLVPGDEVSLIYVSKRDLLSSYKVRQLTGVRTFKTSCQAIPSAIKIASFVMAKHSTASVKISAKRMPMLFHTESPSQPGHVVAAADGLGVNVVNNSVPARLWEEVDGKAFRQDIAFLLDIEGMQTREISEFEASNSVSRFTNMRFEHFIKINLPDEFFTEDHNTRHVAIVAAPKPGRLVSGRYNGWQDPGSSRFKPYKKNVSRIAILNQWANDFPRKEFKKIQREHLYRIETALETPAYDNALASLKKVSINAFSPDEIGYCPKGKLREKFPGYCKSGRNIVDVAEKYCSYERN